MGETIEKNIYINAEESGIRLDRYLSMKFPIIGRLEWQSRIREGEIFISGSQAKPSRKIKTGDIISFSYIKKDEPGVNEKYSVIYEDDVLFVLNKPPDLPVHPSGIYWKNTLYSILKRDYGEDFPVRLVHRLDRETSGVLVLAKTREAAGFLQKEFISKNVYKEYRVLVEGIFPEYFNASGFLNNDTKSAVRKKRKFSEIYSGEGETSQTEFSRLSVHGEISLLSAVLHTGRMHQIRATLCSLGYPVVGDRLYGIDEQLYLKLIQDEETPEDAIPLRMNRTALHCMKMVIPHPITQNRITFECPVPEDMMALLNND